MHTALIRRRRGGSPLATYAANGFTPKLVVDPINGRYAYGGQLRAAFADVVTFARSGTATYFDSTGTLQTAADGVPRLASHVYEGGQWVNKGLLIEPAATQLLHGTNAFATQTETVTAQAYTLQFRGTGSIALTGAHTATLNGTGANDLVSLTFTPSAGTLTLTPSGTVTYPQLETGLTPSSYIPNTTGSGTATRNAETATIAAAKLPYSASAVSIAMRGVMTYANTGSLFALFPWEWGAYPNDRIVAFLSTADGQAGRMYWQQTIGELNTKQIQSNADIYAPGANVPFSIASRHGSTFINGAHDGTALTADTTPTSLPDTSATNMKLASVGIVTVSRFLMWDDNIADAGMEETSA